jgi:HAD superfamily hydrolase (TIGR01549 family)
MTTDRGIKAIVWDFDGTIADTSERNLCVTKEIVQKMTGKDPNQFAALITWESYCLAQKRWRNWREFYLSDFGFTEEQTDQAGRLWTEYQLKNLTPTPVYAGIEKVVASLQSFPHGIVSQNAVSNISRVLQQAGLLRFFSCIVGYEEVELRKQKPAPDGLLLCIEKLTELEPGYIFYIGDHEVDIETAINANNVFKQRGLEIHIVKVAAVHAHFEKPDWALKPDYVVEDPLEIIGVVQEFDPDGLNTGRR